MNRPLLPKVAMVAEAAGDQAWQAGWLAEHLQREGYDVSCVPMEPLGGRGEGWWKRSLRTLVTECRYVASLNRLALADIVQVYSAPHWSFLLAPLPAILMARRLRKPVLLRYDGREAADHLGRGGALIHPWLKKVQEIVVSSKYLETVFAGHGYRCRVIPNMIDAARFPYRPRMPLRPKLLSVQDLEANEGIDQTLVAFALIRTSFPDATLTIAGVGSQEQELIQLSEALGMECVHFLGHVERHALPTVYADADIFLHASYDDNQPLPLLGAMASGLPVVSTEVGDIPDMLAYGEAGTLVPKANPGAMAKAVTMLMEQPERASLMAHRAKQSISRYTWPSVRPQWGSLYEELRTADAFRDAA